MLNLADTIEKRGDSIIWWLNNDHRKVWDFDPMNPDTIVEYREETYKKYRGRYTWVSRRVECWSNPAYGGYHAWGLMNRCPEVPEVTQ